MDSATARVVLKLQLDDVHAIMKTLPNNNTNGVVNSEWHNMQGQVYAYSIIREQDAGQEVFKKLLSEGQQAERKDKPLACKRHLPKVSLR
jgi:hypothetical protein